MAGFIGTASIGTAIGALSGAAATNATLAWLGGGALSIGGAGMALDAVVLPAVLIGSSIYAKKGEEMLTQATEYAAEVDVQIERMKNAMVVMDMVSMQIKETQSVVQRLDERANQQMEELLHLLAQERGLCLYPFSRSNKNDLKDHYKTEYELCKAIKKILNTPMMKKEESFNQESAQITIEYSERYL